MQELRPSPLSVLGRYPLLVLLVAVACGAAGYLVSRAQAPRYQATGRLFLVDPNSTFALDFAQATYVDPRRNARTRAEIVLSAPVLGLVAREQGVSVENVRERVNAVPSRESDVVTITAEDDSPEAAASLVRLVQRTYRSVTVSRERAPFRRAAAAVRNLRLEAEGRLKAVASRLARRPTGPERAALNEERDLLLNHLDALRTREAELKANAALLGTGVELFEEPPPPEAPISPRPLRSALVAALFGAFAAVGLLWWREGRDPPIAEAQAAGEALGAPVLADLQSSPPWRWRRRRERGSREEEYRRLSYLLDTLLDEGGRVLFVTAARPQDLTIATALRVASALATGDRRIVVVDADRHKRRLSRHLRATSVPGLTDIDGEGADVTGMLVARRIAGSPPIAFLPFGRRPKRLRALEGTRVYRTAVRALTEQFDATVTNGPLLVSLTEANPASLPGVRALVVCGPKTSVGSITDLRGRLELLGLVCAGLVFDRSGRVERALRRLLRALIPRARGRAALPAERNEQPRRRR